jgi:hypothetical protein
MGCFPWWERVEDELPRRSAMNLKKAYRIATFILYMPWIIDVIIAGLSLVFVIFILWISVANRQLADLANLIISLLVFLYSATSSMTKLNNDRKERDLLRIAAAKFFEDCRNMVLSYYPDSEGLCDQAEEQLLKSYFGDWKKHKDIKPFEYQLLDSYLNFLITRTLVEENDKLFLKYRIVTSDMTSHFPALVSELENGDYYTTGTVHNKFIKQIYLLANNSEPKDYIKLELDPEKIEDTISYALKKSNPVMEQLLSEKKNKEKMQYLLNKCYENAYSNIGNLDKRLGDDSKHNLTLLFKYDERFTIPKKQWHTQIKSHLAKTFGKENDLEEAFATEKQNILTMLSPQPFSKSLQDFDYCIERLAPNEHFMYLVYPERFGVGEKGWSVEKFMKDRVVPRAEQYLAEFNKKLVKKYPYLRRYQKRTIDANYYIFHFNRQHFRYYADQDSIPVAIKRFVVKSILESDQAADHLASQLVYVKQVINNITVSGLLFTEDFAIQSSVQAKEQVILKSARKNQLIINNISEIASLGNQTEIFTRCIYEGYFGVAMKRRTGQKYKFAKKLTEKIVENAKEVLQMFESLKTSAA